MRTAQLLAAAFAAVALTIVVLVAHSCVSAAPEKDPLVGMLAPTATADDVFQAGPVDRAIASMLATGAAQALTGSATPFYGKSACAGAGGNPLVLPVRTRPTIGRLLQVRWTTAPSAPPDMPARPCWLLMSTKPSPAVSLTPWHADGCQLLVVPEHVFAPTPGTFLTQSGGTVQLSFVPDSAFLGAVWYLQLLVANPQANAHGIQTSPGIRIVVGN